MANVLEFALGLQNSEFLSRIGVSIGVVDSLAAAFELMSNIAERTWGAIEMGAKMQAMASATGESVSMLYKFQEGLAAVGTEGADVSGFLLRTQRALSGVNEQGLQTDVLFSKLGLDIGKLRSEDTVIAITEISTALSKLNPNQAAGIAENIFGRFDAQQAL